MGKVVPLKKRVPRKREGLTKEICISCGHYVYENQEIEFVHLGEKAKSNLKISARHMSYADCQVSITIGEPSSPWGPTRK